MQWRTSASCRGKATSIAACCDSQRRVLPSMSVNRKVTVPVGSVDASVRIIEGIGLGAGQWRFACMAWKSALAKGTSYGSSEASEDLPALDIHISYDIPYAPS